STVSLDYAPSTNYKASGSSGVAQAIGGLSCGNNTNTTGGLAMAASVINYVNQPSALNHIVLFTDGVANGINASFPIRTNANVTHPDYRMGTGPAYNTGLTTSQQTTNNTNCASSSAGNGSTTASGLCNMAVCATSTSAVTGVLGQGAGFQVTGGSISLFQGFSTNYPYKGTLGSGDSSPSYPSGCSSVQSSFAYIPNTDRFGNSTSGSWDTSSGVLTYGTSSSGYDNVVEQVNPNTAPNNAP